MPRLHTGRARGLLLTALCAATLALVSASPAHAQTVSDPRIAEFDPSPDHWSVLDNGQPAVLRYELGMYLVGATTPFLTVDMGKPSPGQDGRIRFDFTAAISGVAMPAGEFEARVSAIGPEGSASSDSSNPFTFTASGCTLSLSAATIQAPAAGGPFSVGVSTGDGCRWSASTSQTWLVLAATGGIGTGTLPFQVRANTSATSRTGMIYIGGQALTLWQAASATASSTVAPTVSWPTPLPVPLGTPLTSLQLNATASVPGTFSYNPPAGTVLPAGSNTLTATFVPADMATYRTVTTYAVLVVGSATFRLTVSRPSGGTVGGAGINCGTSGSVCQVTMPSSMTLGVQASADIGYTFSGWTGDCSGTSPSYWLALTGVKTCGASFTPATTSAPAGSTTGGTSGSATTAPAASPYTLTISRPTGGTVNGAGISCGTSARSCQVSMPASMTLGMQATPDAGYAFTGWTGDCSGSNPSYWLNLNGTRTCGAIFSAVPSRSP